MISNKPSSQTHATAPTQKKHNQYKKVKHGTTNPRRRSNDQMTTNKNSNNHDGWSDFSTLEDNNKIAETATGLIGTCVQVFVKNDTQLKGTLSKSTSTAHDHLGLLLKTACDTKPGLKKDDLALSTGAKTQAIKNNDLEDGIPAKMMQGKNVVKIDQEASANRTRQEYRLQGSLSPTTVVLDEGSLASLELRDSPSFSVTPSGDQSALLELKTGLNEEMYTTELDRSAVDFKSSEQKAIDLANEMERSSSDNAQVLEKRGRVSEYKYGDEQDRYGAVTKHTTNHNGNGTRRPCKSSVKTYEPKTLHSNNNSINHQAHQNNTPGQMDNQKTSSGNSVKPSNKYAMTINTTQHTNSTNIQYTISQANRRKSHWSINNSKHPRKRTYQNKKWIRNDGSVHNSTTNNGDAPVINTIDSAINNETHVVPPNSLLKFKFNILATEFIPFGGPHTLYNEPKTNDIAASTSTTSSNSSLATPQTPPPNNQNFVSVNDMFIAPFNKPGYSRSQNTVPFWLYGNTSYRNHYDFTAHPDMGFQMDQWFYGYHQFDPSFYSVPHYFSYQHYQHQCKPIPQNHYPVPAYYGNNMHVANHQFYPGVFPHQNQYHHQGENQYSAPVFN